MMLVGTLDGTGLWLLQLAKANHQWQSHRQSTSESLAFAKEALIAYAVNYADNYGHNVRGGTGRLPCPADAKHSGPASRCGVGDTGYLPAIWSRGSKRLDIDHVEKFLDQDLWYSVSPTYRFNPSFNVLNSNSHTDLLSVDLVDNVVAVIIAPGPPLPGQDRLRENAGISDYLEGENADEDLDFSTVSSVVGSSDFAQNSGSGNDQLIWIRQSELLPLIEKRVLGYVKDWLQEYYVRNGYFPYAAPFEDLNGNCSTGLTAGRLPMGRGDCSEPGFGEFVSVTVAKSRTIEQIWFNGSQWSDLIYYQVDADCAPGGLTGSCGVPTAETMSSLHSDDVKVLLVSAGQSIEASAVARMQSRESADRALVEYFEVPDLLAGQSVVNLESLRTTVRANVHSGAIELINDQFLVIR